MYIAITIYRRKYLYAAIIIIWYICSIHIVLMIGFTSGQFIGSESSGFIEVIVRITGGTSSSPITVTVTPTVQSPVSAMGM